MGMNIEALYIAGLLAIGRILKSVLPQPRYIPLITWSVGVLVWCGNEGWDQWPKAILIAAAATGIHSAGKNTLQALFPEKPNDTEEGQ